jgi:hypothetical protein
MLTIAEDKAIIHLLNLNTNAELAASKFKIILTRALFGNFIIVIKDGLGIFQCLLKGNR